MVPNLRDAGWDPIATWIDSLNKQKITGFWFALIEFGLVWFGLLIPQTHKQINNY